MKKISTGIKLLFLGLFLILMVGGNIQNWFKIFGITLILAIFFGRFYCGYICPMNTLMIYTEKISRKLGIQRSNIPKFLQWKYLSSLIFLLTIGFMFFSKIILKKEIPIIVIFLLLSVLTTIFFKQELFHNQLCPFGYVQSIFGRKSIYSHIVLTDKCIGCKICEKNCPSGAIKVNENKKAFINKTICHQCSNCKDVCPVEAITYSK